MTTVIVARIVAVPSLLVVVSVVVVGVVSTAVIMMDVVDGQLRGFLMLNYAANVVGTTHCLSESTIFLFLEGNDDPAYDGLWASEDSLD